MTSFKKRRDASNCFVAADHNEALLDLGIDKNIIGHWSANRRSIAVASEDALYLCDITI